MIIGIGRDSYNVEYNPQPPKSRQQFFYSIDLEKGSDKENNRVGATYVL